MSNVMNSRIRRLSWVHEHRVHLVIRTCLVISSFIIQGCVEGDYVGQRLDPPAMKVVLFGIEGPDGEEFTEMLGTRLTKMGKIVVYGDQLGKPTDLMASAKIARDNQAGAFIRGRLTASEIVGLSKYTVSGTFTLHEVEAGDQIGGIANASYTRKMDPFIGLGKAFSALPLVNQKKFEEEKIKDTRIKSVQCRLKLAEHVGSELCCKGLGGTTSGRHIHKMHK